MFNKDGEFNYRPGRVYIPANWFTGMSVGAINEGGAGNFAYGEKWEGSSVGAPISQEISTFGINATLMAAAADEVNHLMHLPYDYDIHKNMYVRVHWTSGSATTADTIDWLVRFQAIELDSTVLASPSTALDTQPAQDNVIGAFTYQVTSYGVLNADTITEKQESIQWEVEMDAFAAGLTEDKFFLGLELVYSPKRLAGPDGMRHEAKRHAFMLSKHYNS